MMRRRTEMISCVDEVTNDEVLGDYRKLDKRKYILNMIAVEIKRAAEDGQGRR